MANDDQERIAPHQLTQQLLGLPESRAARYLRKRLSVPSKVTHGLEYAIRSWLFTLGIVALIESQFFIRKNIAEWAQEMPDNQTGSSLDELLNFSFLALVIYISAVAVIYHLTQAASTLLFGPRLPVEDNFLLFYERTDRLLGDEHIHSRRGPRAIDDTAAWQREEAYIEQIISELLYADHLGDQPKEPLWRAIAFLLSNVSRHRPPRSLSHVATRPPVLVTPQAQSVAPQQTIPETGAAAGEGDQRQNLLRQLCARALGVAEQQLDEKIRQLKLEDEEALQRHITETPGEYERLGIPRPRGGRAGAQFQTIRRKMSLIGRTNRLRILTTHRPSNQLPVMTPLACLPDMAPRPEEEAVERVISQESPVPTMQPHVVADPWSLPVITGGRGLYIKSITDNPLSPTCQKDIQGFQKVDIDDAGQNTQADQIRAVDIQRDLIKNEGRQGLDDFLKEGSTINDDARQGNFSQHLFRSIRQRILRCTKNEVDQATLLATFLKRWCCHQDPRTPDVRNEFIEQLLYERALCLMALLADSGSMHFDRWQYWIQPNALNFSAFKQLTAKNRVRLIYTLLSGPEGAHLLALSLVQHPQFSVKEYAEFIANFARFSRSTINKIEENDEHQKELRRSMMLRHLTILAEPSARRDLNAVEPQLGLVGDFRQQHPLHVAELLRTYTDLLRFEELEKDKVCLSYTDQNDQQVDFDSEGDHTILCGSDLNQDLDILSGVFDTDDNNQNHIMRIAAQTRMQARRREQVRCMLADQENARTHIAEYYWGMPEGEQRNQIVHEFAASNPDFMLAVFTQERVNNDTIELFKQLLHDMMRGLITAPQRFYIWSGLIKILGLNQPDEFSAREYVRNYIGQHAAQLLQPHHITQFSAKVLKSQTVTEQQCNLLLCYSFLAMSEAHFGNAETRHNAIAAFYNEVANDTNIYKFYLNILQNSPLVTVFVDRILETITAVINDFQTTCGEHEGAGAVSQLLDPNQDLGNVSRYLAQQLEQDSDSIEYQITKKILCAWLTYDRIRQNELHAWNFLLDYMTEPSTEFQFELAAQMIKVHLALPKESEFYRCRIRIMYEVLKKLTVTYREHDQLIEDQFRLARILKIIKISSSLTAGDMYHFASDMMYHGPVEAEHDFQSSKNLVWIFVNDAYPQVDFTYTLTFGELIPEERQRIDYCAVTLLNQLSAEFAAAVDNTFPLRTATLQALRDDSPLIPDDCPDHLHSTLLATLLKQCSEQAEENSHDQAATFNYLLRQYMYLLNTQNSQFFIPPNYPRDAEVAISEQLLQQFKSYLATYHRRSQVIFQRFVDKSLENGDQQYWQSFRLSTLLLHQHYTLLLAGVNNQAVPHLLTMIYRGFRAGRVQQPLLTNLKRQQAWCDAGNLLVLVSDLLEHNIGNKGVPTLDAVGLPIVEKIMTIILDQGEHDDQAHRAIPDLPEECNTYQALLGRLVAWLLSPRMLDTRSLHQFSIVFLPRLLAFFPGTDPSDAAKLRVMFNTLPDVTPNFVKLRLVLACAYRRWYNAQNRRWASWLGLWHSVTVEDAYYIQRFKNLLADDVTSIVADNFMNQAGAPDTFRTWLRKQMTEDIPIIREAVLGIQDDEGSDEEQPLLGGEPPRRNYGGRHHTCNLL